VTDEKPVSPPDATIAAVDAASQPEPKPEPGPKKTARSVSAPSSASSNTGVWLVLLLLIAALGGGAWYLGQVHQHHQQVLSALHNQVQQQQQDLEARQEAIAADIDQQLALQNNSLRTSVGEIEQRLDNTLKRVQTLSNVNRDDWKLAEAEYLLQLANQRVLLERSSSNAVALAQVVDEILRNLNDPELHPVRRALADEMGELKLAGDIDREGVYLRLLTLSRQLDKLPLIEPLGDNEDPWLLAEEQQQALSAWAKVKRGINNLLRQFSDHLRIRDHGQPVPAILPPDNRIYLKQNLRLMLEQAQAALLREEAQIYQASLEKANEWLALYFPLNPQSLAAQAEIAELQNAVITQSLPTFAESTQLLKAYIGRRVNTTSSIEGEVE
jgi:uroporphyrin-3 C-methyltransferase